MGGVRGEFGKTPYFFRICFFEPFHLVGGPSGRLDFVLRALEAQEEEVRACKKR